MLPTRSVRVPLPCDLSLRGLALRFQYVVAPTTATPCLGLPASASNIERATLDV